MIALCGGSGVGKSANASVPAFICRSRHRDGVTDSAFTVRVNGETVFARS